MEGSPERPRYGVELKMAVGKLLASREKPRRGELALFAETLKVKQRTLRNWRDHARAEVEPTMGRPRLAREAWRAALRPVARTWKALGRSAGLPRVMVALEKQGLSVSITIVRELLRRLKARWARVVARARAAARVRVAVYARDVLWSQDATHLGRDERGRKVEALAVKDVASTTAIEHSIGGPACAEDVLALLVRAKLVRGTLPLVLAMDNGPANRNELVCSHLRAERVVVLWNVPHTPEHNAWIECMHGELKVELDASGVLWMGIADPTQGPRSIAEPGAQRETGHLDACVSRTLRVLNARPRPSRGGPSAAELDTLLDRAEDLVDRERFYEAACAAIQRAVLGIENPRARRRAEREAIWCTLEELGLVIRTRGRGPATCSKAERLS